VQPVGLAPRPFCAQCADVIGVYEPVVLLFADGRTRTTALTAEPGVPADAVALHPLCYAARAPNLRLREDV
jgi:hypothetical protein